jgi:hypothetical protein
LLVGTHLSGPFGDPRGTRSRSLEKTFLVCFQALAAFVLPADELGAKAGTPHAK